MGTAMTRRRSGPWPDLALYALRDIFADLSRKQGSGREIHHLSDISSLCIQLLLLCPRKRSIVFSLNPSMPKSSSTT